MVQEQTIIPVPIALLHEGRVWLRSERGSVHDEAGRENLIETAHRDGEGLGVMDDLVDQRAFNQRKSAGLHGRTSVVLAGRDHRYGETLVTAELVAGTRDHLDLAPRGRAQGTNPRRQFGDGSSGGMRSERFRRDLRGALDRVRLADRVIVRPIVGVQGPEKDAIPARVKRTALIAKQPCSMHQVKRRFDIGQYNRTIQNHGFEAF